MSEQKREHFRITYPVGQNAQLVVKKADYQVVDVSQGGIKFSLNTRGILEEWQENMPIKGSLTFLHGSREVIEGVILRVHGDTSVVVKLTKPIPLKVMYDEHRFVIQKFGE